MLYTELENLTQTLATEQMDINQLMVAAMFGGSASVPSVYDPTKTYNKNDKILVTDPTTGAIQILTCKTDSTTGTFDQSHWVEFNLFSGSGSGSGNAMGDTTLVTALDNLSVCRLLNF